MVAETLDLGLDGKVAIVAGGGAQLDDNIGNGRAACILLARAGCRVLVVDRDLSRAENTVTMIAQEGGTAAAAAGDLTEEAACKRVVEDATNRWGRLDVLDNNVGIGSRATVLNETVEKWDLVMDVNVKPMFLMSKYAIPAMVASGDGGSIVNISSISATRPRGLTAYSTSKGAVMALTQAMAVDHGADGIRVNCILPGPVYTPMVYAAGMTEEMRAHRQNASLLGIEGEPWDVGHAVLYLASKWARYVTGQLISVDGGCTLSSKPRGAMPPV